MSSYIISSPAKIRGLDSDIAKTLIRKHAALNLEHQGVMNAKLNLAVLINALLQVSRDNGFIKYDAFDSTIQVKAFDSSPVIYQYNPFRDPANRCANGQAASKTKGRKTDFLAWETFPENEHYLIWQAPSRMQYGILVQPAPIVPGHLIIASLNKNPDTKQHFSQQMPLNLFKDMHALRSALAKVGYVMGYNPWGAGASVDHFHVQAVPAIYLPLIGLLDQNKVYVSYKGHDQQGVMLDVIDNEDDGAPNRYPANALVMRSTFKELLFERKKQLLDYLNREKILCNILSWQQNSGIAVDVFLPRGEESVMDHAFNAGYVEMAGMLVMPNKGLFDHIVEPQQGEQALCRASYPIKDFSKLVKIIKMFFR